MPDRDQVRLRDGDHLLVAEQTLDIWATQLAEAGRDSEAAEALRIRNHILTFRCSFVTEVSARQPENTGGEG